MCTCVRVCVCDCVCVCSPNGPCHTLTCAPDLQLLLSTNGAPKPQTVPVFYTVGWWNQTQPIPVALVAGKNTLTFTRFSVRELGIKGFNLYKEAPVVPKPPGNYTPSPPAPSPPPGDYIEVSPG